jgi:hypothetical protein
MKTLIGLAVLVGVAVVAMVQAPAPAAESLTKLVPQQALLVLEAKDFAALVRDWNASPEKAQWLKSENYEVFSRSRLLLRLADAQEEFAGAAGFTPDMPLLEAVAGGESVLALYDIGKLEFLYVTRLPSAKAVETVLWQKRNDYQPRNAGGHPYYVRTEPRTRRVAAFAVVGDTLLLATRENLLSGALLLMAGGRGSIREEAWYAGAAGSRPAGELRMVLNLEALARSAHFRSYWIQGRVSDSAAVVDVFRSTGEVREERTFFNHRDTEGTEKNTRAVGEAVGLVPEDAGLYRAWASPPVEQAIETLERKVLAPRSIGQAVPPVSQADDTSLETRIDDAPLVDTGGRFQDSPLRKLLEGVKLEALVEWQSSRPTSGGVFVNTPATVVLLASSDWDAAAARAAVAQAVADLWTTSNLGLTWTPRDGYHTLAGLAPVAVAARGRLLVVSGTPLPLPATPRPAPVTLDHVVYAATFQHGRERANLARLMSQMEGPRVPDRPPLFFSQNLASLSGALARVESASILVRDNGTQTVIYKLRP